MKTIFIVDDSDTNLAAAKAMLDGTYRAYALRSAARMFKFAEKILPDLILLDITMPEMNGFEAIQVLKSDERLKNVPVIFLTAMQDAEEKILGLDVGAHDVISKPLARHELIASIEAHLHGTEGSDYDDSRQEAPLDAMAQINPELFAAFCKDVERAVKTLRETSSKGDLKRYTITAHAMKAALANIGETEMSKWACALEEAGLCGDTGFIAANTENFIKSLKVLTE